MRVCIKIIILFFLILAFGITISRANNMTIVLDPGHGGDDVGAIAINGSYEKDMNLKIARYLKEYLSEYPDVNVILAHNGLSKGTQDIYARAMIARDNKADLLVSIHLNSIEDSDVNGAEIYVTADKSCSKYNKEMTALGNKVLKNLSKIGIQSRGVRTKQISGEDPSDVYNTGTIADYYGIIRYAMRGTAIDWGVTQKIVNGEKIPVDASMSADVKNGEGVSTILIEHCYISSNKDIKYADSDSDLKKLAKADADAIIEQYGLSKTVVMPDKEKCEEFNIDEENAIIYAEPDTNIENIKSEYENAKTEKEELGTGSTVTIDEKDYMVIKLGDANGDGKVLASDALKVLKYSTNSVELDDIYVQAVDVTKDGKALAADALQILKFSTGSAKINL